jgi:hypothetical protein
LNAYSSLFLAYVYICIWLSRRDCSFSFGTKIGGVHPLQVAVIQQTGFGAWMVGVAALVREQAPQRFVVGRSRHFQVSSKNRPKAAIGDYVLEGLGGIGAESARCWFRVWPTRMVNPAQ